ncbi:hypothetical protein SISSUDRAFT_753301 [Sistotremastrum suecicum HHB10207 ss-3]|uniref:Uncharacterized protein n=1 Tax=Sistotremastrum suecicum HHB10207 ss-3 TaxID=1314776 RepID=A0A166DEK7_9AGAM|nr:hypothetical protein SISSUDRAFT_753301 [Sistotremastrum suecicum HHB10207 ss-3]
MDRPPYTRMGAYDPRTVWSTEDNTAPTGVEVQWNAGISPFHDNAFVLDRPFPNSHRISQADLEGYHHTYRYCEAPYGKVLPVEPPYQHSFNTELPKQQAAVTWSSTTQTINNELQNVRKADAWRSYSQQQGGQHWEMGQYTNHMQPANTSQYQYNDYARPSPVLPNWQAGYGGSEDLSGYQQEFAHNTSHLRNGWNADQISGKNDQPHYSVRVQPDARKSNGEPEIPALAPVHLNENPEASLALTTTHGVPLAHSPFQNIFSAHQCLLDHTTNICPHFLPRILLYEQLPRRPEYGISEEIFRELLKKFEDLSFFPPGLLGFDAHVYRGTMTPCLVALGIDLKHEHLYRKESKDVTNVQFATCLVILDAIYECIVEDMTDPPKSPFLDESIDRLARAAALGHYNDYEFLYALILIGSRYIRKPHTERLYFRSVLAMAMRVESCLRENEKAQHPARAIIRKAAVPEFVHHGLRVLNMVLGSQHYIPPPIGVPIVRHAASYLTNLEKSLGNPKSRTHRKKAELQFKLLHVQALLHLELWHDKQVIPKRGDLEERFQVGITRLIALNRAFGAELSPTYFD